MLIARGEFSIVIAALGSGLADGPDLTALAAGYVLITAVIGRWPRSSPIASSYPAPPSREQTAHTYPSIFSIQAENRRRLERTR